MRTPLIVSTLLAATLAATDARAGATPSPISVDVELTESSGQASRTFTVTLTMAFERDCASVSVDGDARAYAIEVCRSDGSGVLSFDVTRQERGKAPSTRKFRVSSRLTAGKRHVVGRIVRDGETTEIAATVQ